MDTQNDSTGQIAKAKSYSQKANAIVLKQLRTISKHTGMTIRRMLETISENPKDNPPLSQKTLAVLKLLKTIPEGEAMTGPKILETLDKKNIYIDQSTLTKIIIPELRLYYGVKNRRRIGYYLRK